MRVVADDLIWASRLQAAVEKAGAAPVRQGGDAAVVDLNGRTYDGVGAVAEAAARRHPRSLSASTRTWSCASAR